MSRSILFLFSGAMALASSMAAATPPSLVSLSPAVSSGGNQALTMTYNAPGGYQTLDVLNVLINNFLDGRQACYLAYSRSANALYIVADNGDATQLSGKVMDGTGTVSNSQCSVALASSSASGSGNTFTLVLNVSFSSSFAGNKVVYAAARDLAQNNSGWQTVGVHTVPGAPVTYPNPVGMTPQSGNTLVQTITFTFQDQSDATNLQTVWALINTAIDGRAACYVAYYRPGNRLYLYPDNGDGTQASNIALPGNSSIGNSQCSISAQGASAQTSGNTLTVTVPVTFTAAFAGFKGVWLAAQTMGGAQTSPWQALGAWVVPTPAAAPVLSSGLPTTNTAGGGFSVQLPLLNIGSGAAAGVQLTAATLGTLPATTPLPLAVGAMAAGTSATVNLSFNAASLTVGTNYVLTLQGSYQSGGSAQAFSLYRIVTFGAPAIFQAPPNPVNVTPALDSPHAVTQSIAAAAGGTLTATGADGSVFTLVFPPNAMLADEAITMTPIAGLAGAPSGYSFAAGVQLAPDGLTLMAPATLTIQPATSVPVSQQGGFSYGGSGQDFHPYPLQPQTAVTLQVLHFSGYGVNVTIGTPVQTNPGTPRAQLEAALAAAYQQLRQSGPSGALIADIAGLLQEYYDQVLTPDVNALAGDPTQADKTVSELDFFVHYMDTPGLIPALGSFSTETRSLLDQLVAAMTDIYNGYFSACIDGGAFGGKTGRFDLGMAMANMNNLLKQVTTLGGVPQSFPNFNTQFPACMIGSLQLTVTMEASGQTSGSLPTIFDLTIKAQVPLTFDKAFLDQYNRVAFSGQVPIQYTQPMHVTVTGPFCGSKWQWSQESTPEATLEASALLDPNIIDPAGWYWFTLVLSPIIYEQAVGFIDIGNGSCVSTGQEGPYTFFWDTFNAAFPHSTDNVQLNSDFGVNSSAPPAFGDGPGSASAKGSLIQVLQ